MTSTDLKAYSDILEQMKGMLNSTEFEQTFTNLTMRLSKSKQFLLRMELKRLAQPCNYFIDLRGHVDGEVKPFEYRNKTHYLDDKARQIFEAGVTAYREYTVGVYEEVMSADNNYRVRHRKETDERIRNSLDSLRSGAMSNNGIAVAQTLVAKAAEQGRTNKVIQFGNYHLRCEERMNYGIEVEIRTLNERFTAISSDLSVSGCKLKVLADKIAEPGEIINLVFTGLEREFALNLPAGLDYELIATEPHGKYRYWRLKRVAPEQQPQFNQFLESFINGNKRRYKINLDNTLEATLIKGYEQYYLHRISTLPIYLSVNDGRISSRFCLTSDYNKGCWHYFLDEQQQSVISHLLSPRRLKLLLSQDADNRSDILYCFTHAAKGKLYFYAALNRELDIEPELRAMFFGFGASKPSWRIFHLSLLKTSSQHSQSEFVIPGANNVQHMSPLLSTMLEDIYYIVALTDISSSEQRQYYTGHAYHSSELSALNKFGLSKTLPKSLFEAVPIHYVNSRIESRYLYKTSVVIRTHNDEPPRAAFSRDFSVSGLQLETPEPVNLDKGDLVLLELPDLQKITNKHQLSNLPYEVIAVSKSRTIMNLRATKTEAHEGKLFFKQLIHTNRSKLTVAAETPKYPGMSEALRNMYLKALSNVAIFVHRIGLRHEINVLGRGIQDNALHQLLTLAQQDSAHLSFELLTKNHFLNNELANQLKQMKRQDPTKAFELYIRVTTNGERWDFSSNFSFDFATADELKIFALDAFEQQQTLFAFRFFLVRTAKPDPEYIARELSYISVYAIHKAKSLEDELLQVEGVADGVEISAEFVNRFAPEQTKNQQQRRLAILRTATALTI